MKKYLQDLLKRRQAKLTKLQERSEASQDVNEVRSIGVEIDEVKEEIRGINEQLVALEQPAPTVEPQEPTIDVRGLNPLASYGLRGVQPNAPTGENEEPTATMEYRSAFMKYFRTGEMNEVLITRADAANTSADLGVLIPVTVMQEIIKGVEKVRGQLYGRVKKTNLKGGVKYPLGAFSATFKRITETTKSDRQNGGKITGYVQFGYNIGEIRLARTLLETILTVPVFEAELGKVIAEAYVEAMDFEILKGETANNECEGILTEAAKETGSRILPTNIIEFTAEEIADWTAWEKKLFAEIPLSMERERPEFVMAKQTYVANLATMKDANGQPIKKAGYDVNDRMHKFNEYEVNRVEKDVFKDFDSATTDEYFGMFWVPEKAYAINSNMEFVVTRYFDHEANQYVDKALVINDGKILDPKYIYLLKKKVA